MVDTYEGRKTSWRRLPGRPRNVWLNKIQEDTDALLLSIRCGDLRSPGVTAQRNGHSEYATTMMMVMMMMMMDVSKMEGKTFFEAPTGCPEPGLLNV